MADPEQLRVHAERVRARLVFGRSRVMPRLFDFLVECSIAGKAPKEIEVAVVVFDQSPTIEVTQNALVRVYIHKLRRKLEEYYAGPGLQEDTRLVLLKGEYRFALERRSPPEAVLPTSAESGLPSADSPTARRANTRRSSRWLWGAGIVLATVANIGLWVFTHRGESDAEREVASVRATPVWAPLLADNRPVFIVVGDYYIFGELDDSSPNVRRLVRDFDINSPNDLEQYLKNHPELADRYMDMALEYLPVSAAYVLHDLIPILEPSRQNGRRVQVILASRLTADMLKSADIVYVGLLSGMRLLREPTFSSSEFQIGDSYDELVDRHTRQRYFSEAGFAEDEQRHRGEYSDYGYFSTFNGPGGNRIMVIAGTRDEALMHTGEVLTHTSGMRPLHDRVGDAANFEALYAVEALDRTNLTGRLIFTGRLDTRAIWSGGATGPAALTAGNSP